MPALSIRIEPELGKMLDLEVSRRNTTRSRYVQELLQQALAPKDSLALLLKVRARYGIADTQAPRTNKSAKVKALVKAAVEKKHTRSTGGKRKTASAA
jgi:hypothetical protein